MFDPSRWIVRLYLAIVMIVIITMFVGCGHRYYSSDGPKVDRSVPQWQTTYIDGIGWCECYVDDAGVKHCHPVP